MRLRPIARALTAAVAAGCSAVSSANVSSAKSPTATTVATIVDVTPTTAGVATPAPAPDATTSEPAPAVFVVGDSLTVGAEPWLAAAVRARGWDLTGVDARVGRVVPEGLAVLKRKARSLPDTVIVALGTNNLGASPADIDAWMGTARRLVGPERRLVWVNLSLADDGLARLQRYHAINASLAASAPRWRVEILDWDRWTHRNHIATKSDGIHYEDGVYRLRALFYAGALRPSVTSRA
jgi:hypothetical protein